MTNPEEQDLSAFLTELHTETDRGLALVGAAVIDDQLGHILRAFFCDAKAAERLLDGDRGLGTFSARTDACLALALIEKHEHREMTIIRKIRNEFAHARHGLTFGDPNIVKLCQTLQSETSPRAPGQKFTPKSMFRNAVFQIVVRLYRRPEFVEEERRIPRPWVQEFRISWGGPGRANPTRVEIVEQNRGGQDGISVMSAEIKAPPKNP